MSAPINRVGSKLSTDSKTLAFLGKKAVLKRRFGFWSLLAFAVCELITWETVLALFSQGLENGGPAGLFWGFLIAWFSTMSVYVTISELASMAPIASGQYYWVYMLAPPSYRVIGSYLVGWLTTLAWIATVATESLFAGTIIQGLLILNYPSYESKQWQGTLLTWFVICINVFTNVILPDALPYIEMVVMVFHIGGFFGIMISLLVKTSQNEQFSTASAVFLTAFNNGGWSTQGLSFCIGFLGNVATFVGADASVHMAEEVEHASLNIPRAICYGMIINGAVGLAMMLTILFCLGDVESVLEGKTGFPFIQIFYNSVQSVPGAIAMGTIVLALTWCCSTGITTAASRMAWSFGRDKGLPFSNYIGKHDDKRGFPKTAVFVVTAFAALLTLIYIGSYAAFNDVISLTITGFYGSYLAPCALLLYHRFQDNIVEYGRIEGLDGNHEVTEPVLAVGHDEKKNKVTTPEPESTHEPEIWEPRLMWGPWRIGGWLGIINNMYACVYMVFVIFWSVWPATTPVVANTMNYSIVVTGGVLIFSAIYYYARGRESYKGPVKDVEVESTGHGIVNSESDHV